MGSLDGARRYLAGIAQGKAFCERGNLASRHAKLYNRPHVERSFSKDYPDGHQADTAGNLIHDIDGNPLEIGGRIVGRKVVGGSDEALPAEEFNAIAKEGTGRPAASVALSKNTVGRVTVDRSSGKPTDIGLSNKLTPKELPGIYGHEIGHVIDRPYRSPMRQGI